MVQIEIFNLKLDIIYVYQAYYCLVYLKMYRLLKLFDINHISCIIFQIYKL